MKKEAVTNSANACENASQSHSKTETTIEKLSQLLQSCPASEELKSTWERPKKPSMPLSKASASPDPRLGDLHAVLQSGRSVVRGANKDRGIPMWIVIRMCKASWHKDGTWPLMGSDEIENQTQTKSVNQDTIQRVRSIHPSALIIQAEQNDHTTTKAVDAAFPQKNGGPPIRIEPSADEIAEAYRRRGIFVEQVSKVRDEDW
ncbi:uncharacterized protein FA14DRAFT_160748 [Meira miltonrushii]|uniref:Uncharacterized protein n=1 Tax=Meira miltonrushii TaxID=1280837 RepID=A0A316VDQ9_9BASI|nr:uncharacterized protein FA14DRAFT_160748 [Meira miltonrushii]PWN35712.1 hypothetical protein FA14DRAFT_160748 [Meira miltonrushii]